MPPSTQTIPRRAIFMLIALTLVWGTNWPLFPYAVREISVWTFRSFAMIGAGSALLLFARMRGLPMQIPRRYWKTVALATAFYLVIWNVASTYAAILIPSGQAAVLGFTMPLWGALIAWAALGERLNPRLLLAVVLGGIGVTLLMVPSFQAYSAAPLGLAMGLLSAIGWAIGTLILKRANVMVPVLVLTGWQLLLGAVPISIAALFLGDGNWFLPTWQSIAVISWITLVPMCIGNVCWFAIVGLLPANIAGLSSVMVPVVAMVSGALINGEPLGPLQLLSMASCVAALVLALGQKTRPVTQQK
ncbi:MAG: DMT family transporter [Rhodoferax sp.]|nr:DMT family transporter [Rhodoferax sp.]MBP9931112.1 DMT family transporter [Rhodoferax sp.]HQX60699.1 DMT family transporter [Burkholderiaceae bacterium]HQZ08114.1 DMT family transporter [Burkholderiaceae bacterium]